LLKWIADDEMSEESDFRRKEKVSWLANAVELTALLMLIEIKEKNLDSKEVIKNFEAFLPKKNFCSSNTFKLSLLVFLIIIRF